MDPERAWRALLDGAAPALEALRRAIRDPPGAQAALLRRIVAENADSAFGRRHGFARIDGVGRYRAALEPAPYDGFAPWIDRIAGGEPEVLTRAPVVAFEETGGSTSGRKLIPYTGASLESFRLAVLPWLAGLVQANPAVARGRAYVAISPATRPERRTRGGIAIGLESDSAYLGGDLASAFAAVLAVSPDSGRIGDVDAWRIATLAQLVAARDLSFVSVWSPTFLLDLVAALPAVVDRVAARLDPGSARRLERALSQGGVDTERLWPDLACISCWTDGASAPFAARLEALFPQAAVEPKGLLATEGAITLPFPEAGGAIPALTSNFVEFVDEAGAAGLCDSLVPGGLYRALLTTRGGLYRYDIGDLVRCTEIEGGLPRLRFEGRAGRVSDLVGEKLDDAFVVRALAGLGRPAVLAPRTEPRPHYELRLEGAPPDPSVAARVDSALRSNPQYDHARRIGQLGPVRAVHAPDLGANFLARALAAGARVGDTKPVGLLAPEGEAGP